MEYGLAATQDGLSLMGVEGLLLFFPDQADLLRTITGNAIVHSDSNVC
jgi:hypothetical protein